MWTAILRISAILSVGLTIKQIIDMYANEVNAHRIYSTQQATRFLGVGRKGVIKLVKEDKIKAKLVKGNYRILGANILEYLNKK